MVALYQPWVIATLLFVVLARVQLTAYARYEWEPWWFLQDLAKLCCFATVLLDLNGLARPSIISLVLGFVLLIPPLSVWVKQTRARRTERMRSTDS